MQIDDDNISLIDSPLPAVRELNGSKTGSMPAKTGAPPKLLPTCMTKDEGNLGYQPYAGPSIEAQGLELAFSAIAFPLLSNPRIVGRY